MAENETPAAGAEPAKDPESQSIDEAAQAALKSVQEAVAGLEDISDIASGGSKTQVAGDTFNFPAFVPGGGDEQAGNLELLADVNLNVKIELGRTQMLVNDVLKLSEGAVVELDKLAGDPVDVYVNDRHVARGEVLVLNDNFCVRINQILSLPETGRGKAAS